MVTPKYFLVTDSTAEEVERRTGLRGRDTPMGVFVPAPPPGIAAALERMERALHPNRCTCGAWAVVHRAECPAWRTIA